MKKTLSTILSLTLIISSVLTFAFSANAADTKMVSGTLNYSYAAEVLEIVNRERNANGLKSLTMTKSLTDGAMLRAAETTVSFSHTRPNGERCFTAFEWVNSAGENIAYGQRNPSEVMNGWMNSSGHRANILSSSFTCIGIGCFEYNGRLYWAQAFSGGKGEAFKPSGSVKANAEISLKSGVQSRLIVSGNLPSTTKATTAKQSTTKSSTTKQSTTKQSTTKQSTTKQSTTKQSTTKQPTTKQPTTKQPTTNKSTTKKQIIISNKKSIYEIINSILKRYFVYK